MFAVRERKLFLGGFFFVLEIHIMFFFCVFVFVFVVLVLVFVELAQKKLRQSERYKRRITQFNTRKKN